MSTPGIHAITPRDFVLARLVLKGGEGRSRGQYAGDLKSVLPLETAKAAIEELVREGVLEDDNKIALSRAGAAKAKSQFGERPRSPSYFDNVVVPAMALGISPKGEAATRLARGENLRAAVLTQLYALPLDINRVTMSQAVATLAVRALAGVAAPSTTPETSQFARGLGDLSELSALRSALAKLALSTASAKRPDDAGSDASLKAFAERVKQLASATVTPPFSHKAAISQLYDAYGRNFSDAGGLDAFKARLLAAHNASFIDLLPLDDPKSLDPQTRARSEIKTERRNLHFVDRRA